MATSGNKVWAFTEASRRSRVMNGPYSIYRHRYNEDDYIIRATEAAPPNPVNWQRVATFTNGSQTFAA